MFNLSRANKEIRETAKKNGVFMYQIADALCIAETHLSRKLRYELPENEKKQVLAIIEKLSKGC